MKDYYKGISILEIEEELKELEIIDIRRKVELRANSLEGSRHILMGVLLDHPEKYLDKDKRYYLLCRTGRRTGIMTNFLRKIGYDVINLEGGIKALLKENYIE